MPINKLQQEFMIDYLYHSIIHIFKEDNEMFQNVFSHLFLLSSSFMIGYKEFISDIQC